MPTRPGWLRLFSEQADGGGRGGSTGGGMSSVIVSRAVVFRPIAMSSIARRTIGCVMGVLLVVPVAHAAPKKRLADDRRTVVRFDDDTIQGDLTRPDGDLVWSRPRLELPSLVAPPASFERASRRTLLAAADAARSRGEAVTTPSSTADSRNPDGGEVHGETHGEAGARAPGGAGTAADR